MKYLKFLLSFLLFNSYLVCGQLLKPGDGIRISFYNITDPVVGDFFIEKDGNIHLPYIGFVNTTERDFDIVKEEIIENYTKLYRNPEINIVPLLKVNVIGEIGSPGVYYLTGIETLSDLIALAGGETSDSDIDNVIILRDGKSLEIDMESFLEGDENIGEIGIESGDEVYVPRTWWVKARDASIVVSGVAVLVAIASLFTN